MNKQQGCRKSNKISTQWGFKTQEGQLMSICETFKNVWGLKLQEKVNCERKHENSRAEFGTYEV